MLKIKVSNPNAASYQFAYACYMMTSSIFKKCNCKTPATENRLYLYYRELDNRKEFTLEDQALAIAEGNLLPMLKSLHLNPEDMMVDCHFVKSGKDFKLVFDGSLFEVHLSPRVDEKRRNKLTAYVTVIDHSTKRVVSDTLAAL